MISSEPKRSWTIGFVNFHTSYYLEWQLKILYEFKVNKGKYSLYSMNIETEQFKKDYPYSGMIGALLVKD